MELNHLPALIQIVHDTLTRYLPSRSFECAGRVFFVERLRDYRVLIVCSG